MARLTPRSSATRTFCPLNESSAITSGLFHHRAALAAGAMHVRREETLEDRRQLRFDVGDFGELLVQPGAAVLAVPLESVAFAGTARALDDQADGVGGAAWRMGQVGGQQE